METSCHLFANTETLFKFDNRHSTWLQNPKASLTVQAQVFEGMQDARFNLRGEVQRIPEGDIAAAKQVFRKTHPESFWIDFGDFVGYKLVSTMGGRLNGGFGRGGKFVFLK